MATATASKCEHLTNHLVRRIIGGKEHYGIQCLDCGKYEPQKKASISLADMREAIEYDPNISTRNWDRRRAEIEHERQKKDAEWWEKYNAYLKTPIWSSKRERVLKRDNYMCQACLKRPAEQVHHLTYARLFKEPLFDLISVCLLCHDALHHGRLLA